MKHIPIIERALLHGEAVAVQTSSQRHTFRDLLVQSQRIAAALLDSQSDLNEARIAIMTPPGAQYIAAQWGIWRAGGTAVPLSLSATSKELEYTLTDSVCSAVVVTSQFHEKLSPLCDRHGIRTVNIETTGGTPDAVLPQINTDRRAMILYTSGTTSRPKGVVTTHANIGAQIESLVTAWQWRAEDRIPLFLPLHHIHGIINVLSCALWSGGMIEPFSRFDPDAILKRVAGGAFTLFMAVPTIYVKLIELLESMSEQQRTPIVEGFGKMRLMVSGSAALPASVHEHWTSLTGQRLLERYGMTEIGMALSNAYDGERRPGAVGVPLPGVEIRLCSEQGVVIAAEDQPGEIQVKGENVFLEYWNRRDVTAESFQDRWFRTGDIAVLENGYYRIMGRSSVDIIKSGGYKLSALEIEAALLEHASIAECAVVGLADETWGEIVAVAVVLTAEETLDLTALQSWCADRLSKYKIPRRLLIVKNLPRNAMGKVTKPAVRELLAEHLDQALSENTIST